MKSETLEWRELPADGLPDADETVHVELDGSSDPTWLGFLDGGVWRDVVTGDSFACQVTAWAPMLLGPRGGKAA